MENLFVVIPNWNGLEDLKGCVDSLLKQTIKSRILVVENGSTDGSLEFLKENYPQITVVVNKTNLGFAGGVNSGIRKAMEMNCDAIALFNNDAVAIPDWLENLVKTMSKHSDVGIVTCKFMSIDKSHLDSTGDLYTSWGLPFPRGRDETDLNKYDEKLEIFGASGGASLYRAEMLKEIGLFDEDFFAYYEDVDISFRAQLAGWKVRYEPRAVAYHKIGATSSKMKGFTTYQAMKNMPLVLYKNVPRSLMWPILCRFMLARTLFMGRAILRGHGWYAIKGDAVATKLLFTKYGERKQIQKNRKVTDGYIASIITHDLPPNAAALRQLRSIWRKMLWKS